MEVIDDISDEQSSSPCTADMSETFGEPQVVPRVGSEYQVEIPSECDKLQLIKQPTGSEIMANQPNAFSLGLPIPLMWAYCDVENVHGTLEFENSEENSITSNGKYAKPEVEPLDSGKYQMDVVLALPYQSKAKYIQGERHICPLPGSLGESWTEVEHESFLLGLYIFGKNLHLVKRFVGTKGTGDILSFYYGVFYRSDKYRRWSECRKSKNKRFVLGQKIFSGWRQQELFSRIFPQVSEECQKLLTEESKKFTEGKISFEEYIFTIKSKVGIAMFIEAVAIGKGKQDLTGTALEPIKSNPVYSVHPEIPVGKACSALSAADIIRFLTGNFRLSKARSSDLFWEAVWPRLLARGWHSEQPDSKNSLVFLIPGVKKFSRRKLVKGDHYFDSVTDVLNKVALNPALLELESEPKEVDKSGEMTNEQDRCYLQPKKSSCKRRAMKFLIVDTSLLHKDKRGKVREYRSLPVEAAGMYTTYSDSSESEYNTLEELGDNEDELTNTSGSTIMTVGSHEIPSTSPLNEKRQKETTKDKSNREAAPDLANRLAHASESFCVDRKIDVTESKSNSPEACGDTFHLIKIENLYPSSYVAKGTTDRGSEGNINEVSAEIDERSCEKLTETSQKDEQTQLTDALASTNVQPSMNNRRQSTRNRPLTTKALEAMQFGLLSPKRTKKDSEASLRRVRRKPAVTSALANGVGIGNQVADCKLEDKNPNVFDGNST